ncbi:MAG: hypothetical protein LUQ11_00160 [Methylococcaceae bacterium]|nr:hypothetical protein [Methylococcaceae bacterium]
MNKAFNRKHLIALLLAPVLMTGGCATQQGTDQLTGTGVGMAGGAALGCLTGFLASGHAGGCAKGAAVTEWGAVKVSQYQATQVRSALEDQQIYGLAKSVNTTQIKINKGTSTPNMVRPGDSVKLFTDYSVQLPTNMSSTPVSESWTLKKDGKVQADLQPQNSQRTSGGWNADATVPIPTNAELGTYVIEHKVLAGSSYDTDESTFVVSR